MVWIGLTDLPNSGEGLHSKIIIGFWNLLVKQIWKRVSNVGKTFCSISWHHKSTVFSKITFLSFLQLNQIWIAMLGSWKENCYICRGKIKWPSLDSRSFLLWKVHWAKNTNKLNHRTTNDLSSLSISLFFATIGLTINAFPILQSGYKARYAVGM